MKNTELIYVRICSRGFANEWVVRGFESLEEAQKFADAINDDINASADILTYEKAAQITSGFIKNLSIDTIDKLY